jgi:hypothetical protein
MCLISFIEESLNILIDKKREKFGKFEILGKFWSEVCLSSSSVLEKKGKCLFLFLNWVP